MTQTINIHIEKFNFNDAEPSSSQCRVQPPLIGIGEIQSQVRLFEWFEDEVGACSNNNKNHWRRAYLENVCQNVDGSSMGLSVFFEIDKVF